MQIIVCLDHFVNPLNANPTKWSNTLKQFVGNLPTNCLNVLDHFWGVGAQRVNVLRYLILQFNQHIDGQNYYHVEISQLICSANQQIAGLVFLGIF